MHIWCFVHISDQRVEGPLSKLMPNKMPTKRGEWKTLYIMIYFTLHIKIYSNLERWTLTANLSILYIIIHYTLYIINHDIFYIGRRNWCQTRCQPGEVNCDGQPINIIHQGEEREHYTSSYIIHYTLYILHQNWCQTKGQV